MNNKARAAAAEEAAKEIFEAVERDLRDRRGLKHEWGSIDESIQQEIRDTNIASIAKILGIRWKEEQGSGGERPEMENVIGNIRQLLILADEIGRGMKLTEAKKRDLKLFSAGADKSIDRLRSLLEAPPPPDERALRDFETGTGGKV
jgi:hypothetical protein